MSTSSNNEYLVTNTNPDDYELIDLRTKKPLAYKGNTGSMVLQEVDEITFTNKFEGEKNTLSYFSPNNVGILLSVSNKSLSRAKKIFDEQLNPQKYDHRITVAEDDKLKKITIDSKITYEYIEYIQTSLVFGYTALETFTNLSIPENYKYEPEPNSKGIIEIYDKEAIERWIPLKTKISKILTNIYATPPITKSNVWNQFNRFEELRNEIIHQKSINQTNFYKKYFKQNFFKICETPEQLISYFFEKRQNKSTTNPLWPWIINGDNDFPISYDFDSNNFEVIGNIHEGKHKK